MTRRRPRTRATGTNRTTRHEYGQPTRSQHPGSAPVHPTTGGAGRRRSREPGPHAPNHHPSHPPTHHQPQRSHAHGDDRTHIDGLVSVPQRAAIPGAPGRGTGMARTRRRIDRLPRPRRRRAGRCVPAIDPAPAPGRPHYPQPLGSVTDGGPVDRVLIVGPGMVRIRVHDPRTKDPAPPLDLEDDDMLDGRPKPTLLDFLNEVDDDQGDDDAAEVAGIVRTFSRASRRRLGRAIACLDWTEAIYPGWRLALFTATYPDDWRAVCPDPDTAYRHLRALAKRFERATGLKLKGVWKREFQRRGAPHFHVLTPLPAMIGNEPVREWFARSWYEIVASGDERHRRAGTAVDWSEGLRMQDANRAAAYFTGYSAGKATGQGLPGRRPRGLGQRQRLGRPLVGRARHDRHHRRSPSHRPRPREDQAAPPWRPQRPEAHAQSHGPPGRPGHRRGPVPQGQPPLPTHVAQRRLPQRFYLPHQRRAFPDDRHRPSPRH